MEFIEAGNVINVTFADGNLSQVSYRQKVSGIVIQKGNKRINR